MTPAEFRARREQFGLPVDLLAVALGVDERTVRRWESAKNAADVPDFVSEHLSYVESYTFDWVDKSAQKLREAAKTLTAQIGHNPDECTVWVYLRDADLWDAHPEFQGENLGAWWHRQACLGIADEIPEIPLTLRFA